MDDLIIMADGSWYLLADTIDGQFEGYDYWTVSSDTTIGELMNMSPIIQQAVIQYIKGE